MPTSAHVSSPHADRLLPRLPLPPWALAGVVLQVLAIVVIAFYTYHALRATEAAAARTARTLETIDRLQQLQAALVDAETGQRGFLLTDDEAYLAPHTNAVAALPLAIDDLRDRVDSPLQLESLAVIETLVSERLQLMSDTIARRRANDTAGALALVRSGRGKALMDELRVTLRSMREVEQANLASFETEWDTAVRQSSTVTWMGSTLILALAGLVAWMTSRDYRSRETEVWLRTNLAELRDGLQGDLRLETLGERILEFFGTSVQARVGALYVVEAPGQLARVGAYAVAPDTIAERLRTGDGLVGQVAADNRIVHATDVPEGYLPVASAVGSTTPRELIVAPATVDGRVVAVVELGFLHRVTPAEHELVERASDALGIAVRAARDRTRLEELLSRTQYQAEQLQAQQEELRVSNEELEEQSEALRESQARLEAQQAELEQTNANLEMQAQLLEQQKEALTQSQAVLAERAEELTRANEYKSEFLANMSHELRTPLNSTLILAKLLADNRQGNLTDEQVKFARTISSAGKDLLALINDILDLSRIEAGKVDVVAEPVGVRKLIDEVGGPFEALAADKGLAFVVDIDPGTPEELHTDRRRVAQILKNLLSNAFKFTQHGRMGVRVQPVDDARVAFHVHDTGIGIAEEQRDLIFEAFRQADGSTHRKYGGTGLGLSISRDLAALLDGAIVVESEPGAGSTFTLTLPVRYVERETPEWQGAQEPATPPRAPVVGASHEDAPDDAPADRAPERAATGGIADDRDNLSADARVILVIEDDERFAGILYDLAQELGFQCIVTHTANDGLAAAVRYRPSAILLDINLPDYSGLGVLDQLKRNPQTRHVPVHVASIADHTHEALERGAIGYAVKPVARDELVDAFRRLEDKFSQQLRRVLVVEDDARQRESVRELLASDEVEITGVPLAADALTALRETTFDCMVLDLNLPDLSGYELLEQMASNDDVAFPPVIVYTGRSLTAEQEQRLQRHSRSIIIKDARSPERLLDEVTLFLHQVEANLPLDRQRMLMAVRDREAAFEGRRILVVEDDARNIFALSSMLEPKGAQVEIARNGREALERLVEARGAGRRIDLVLMDIMMPEMDGLTAMQAIRARPEWRKLPIIALTAKAMRDDQEKCLAAGANDYIAKPLDVERLLSLVRVWMPT